MVNVGSFNLNLGGMMGQSMSLVGTIFWSIMIFIAISLIAWWIYSSFKNKSVYTNPCTLTWYYENGTKKTKFGLLGGSFVNRHGVNDFRIKIPKNIKKKELGYTPDFSLADADGTLHFITSGDGSIWQQVSHKLQVSETKPKYTPSQLDEYISNLQTKINSGELTYEQANSYYQNILEDNKKGYSYSLLQKPVPTDIKTVTVNSLKSWSEMINKNKMTVFAIGLGMFLIMVIAHLISLYIQTKIKCPATP